MASATTNPTTAPPVAFPEPLPTRRAEPAKIPPLRNGDRLTAAEFERRYDAMPDVRAELIEGVVYVSSPVSADHGDTHFNFTGWLYVYKTLTPGISGSTDATIRLDIDNRPQPDLHLRIKADHGGRTHVSEDGYVVGSPELVVEIALSTASYDLHDKLNAYRRNAILEYIAWRVEDEQIDWFVWREGRYVRLAPDADGLLKSETFPGLWLDPAALIRGDDGAVLRAVHDGLASPEHAGFVDRLRAQAARLAPPAPEEPRP